MTNKGYFSDNGCGDAFLLTDPDTPRRWQNYLYNEQLMSQFDQFAQGGVRYWDEHGQDALLFDSPERNLIIRHPDGFCWSPAVTPFGHVPDDYLCTMDPVRWKVSGTQRNCTVKWNIAVPTREPLEMWTISFLNSSPKEEEYDIFLYLPVNLMGFSIQKYRFYSRNAAYISGHRVPECNAVWVKNGIPELPHDRFNCFLACDRTPHSTDTDRSAFLGIQNKLHTAAAFVNGFCSDSDAYFGETCLAMHHKLSLNAGERKEFRYLTGPASGSEEIQNLCSQYLNKDFFDSETRRLEQAREAERSYSQITTGVRPLDRLANTWAKRQNRLGVIHRKGFRDVLQDSSGMLLYDPDRAREGFSETISVQNPDGSGIRAWKPIIDDKRYSDGPYWIVLAIAEYLRETADFSYLDVPLPYFRSDTKESVWEHMIKGLQFLYNNRSKHGLCKIFFADWNDGLDGPGRKGEGDSTMVTFSLIMALREIERIAHHAGRKLPFDTEAWCAELSDALENEAWTGEYYIRGYRDDGQPYGSPSNSEGSFYMNAQTWAVLSEAAPRSRWEDLLNLTVDKLDTASGMLLFAPSYRQFDPSLGRVSATLPGCNENGGIYNHAAAFFIHALLKAGMTGEAWRQLEKMLPDSEANPSDRSGAEPFVLTNCIFGEDAGRKCGTSLRGWFTGTAAWVLRIVHNGFTGFSPDFDGLHFFPGNIPTGIDFECYRRSFRNTKYIIQYDDTDAPNTLEVNGRPVETDHPLPVSPGEEVHVRVCGDTAAV